MESWPLNLWSKLSGATLGRHPIALAEYLVLSFFAYAVIGMSAASIAEFLNSSYALIVDVRMLNFFRYIGGTAAWVVLGLAIASIFVQNFWCRHLCLYGGFEPTELRPRELTKNEF